MYAFGASSALIGLMGLPRLVIVALIFHWRDALFERSRALLLLHFLNKYQLITYFEGLTAIETTVVSNDVPQVVLDSSRCVWINKQL